MSKYRKQIILSIVCIVILIVGFLIPAFIGFYEPGMIRYLIIDNMFIQGSFLILFPVIGSMIGVLIGYLLAPMLLNIHKKFLGKGMIYGVQEIPPSEKAAPIMKGLFPALFAVNVALMLAINPAMQIILAEGYMSQVGSSVNWSVVVLFFSFIITSTLSMILFTAVWYLMDAGIVYTNKEKAKQKNQPVEIRSVGGWFLAFLKGYAGIGVLIAFYSFFMDLIAKTEATGHTMHISMIIFLVPLPLLITLWFIPSLILYDKTKENRKKFVLKWVEKQGIKAAIDVEVKNI